MTPTLSDSDRNRLDGIVQKMIANKEPDDNIQFVVNDFKKKYATTTRRQRLDALLGDPNMLGPKSSEELSPLQNVARDVFGAAVGLKALGGDLPEAIPGKPGEYVRAVRSELKPKVVQRIQDRVNPPPTPTPKGKGTAPIKAASGGTPGLKPLTLPERATPGWKGPVEEPVAVAYPAGKGTAPPKSASGGTPTPRPLSTPRKTTPAMSGKGSLVPGAEEPVTPYPRGKGTAPPKKASGGTPTDTRIRGTQRTPARQQRLENILPTPGEEAKSEAPNTGSIYEQQGQKHGDARAQDALVKDANIAKWLKKNGWTKTKFNGLDDAGKTALYQQISKAYGGRSAGFDYRWTSGAAERVGEVLKHLPD